MRSFRFRVMFAMFSVVVGTMILTNVLVRAIVEPSILHEFDQQLKDEANETILEIGYLYPERVPDNWNETPGFVELVKNLERRARSRGKQRWFIRLYNANEKLVYESDDKLPNIPPPTRNSTEQSREHGEYRWVDMSFSRPNGPVEFWVQTGRSRQALIEDFNLLDRTLLVRGLFVIALAPLGGYYLAKQVLTPIANIITTASRLQPRQLSERLPVAGTNDELDKLSATINGMLDRIATYIDKNRAFVANAAHELRSPLAALRSSAEVALNRSRSPEEYAHVLSDMIEEVGRLTSMVNRLLLLAESDAGGLALGAEQSASLDKVIRESVDMFQAVAESLGVQIDLGDLPAATVRGDEVHLRHIVRNLLDNAIKFSPQGGVVAVTLRRDDSAKRAIFTVRDQGVGISAADLPRLFERFFRGDRSRHRDEGRAGSGLGLSICDAIIASLGGTIQVDSEAGKGATFTVSLPLAAS